MSMDRRATSLALTAGLHGMNHAMFNMLTPLGLTIMRFFQFEEISRVTLGFTLYLMMYGFGQIPIGFVSDRLPRKALLAAGVMLNGVALAAVALFPDYKFFLVGMTLSGFGAAAYHPVGAAYLSDLYSEKKGSALGICGVGATVGLIVGPWVGGVLCGVMGWRGTFLVFSAACVLLGFVFLTRALEPERERVDESQPGGWDRAIIGFLIMAAAVFTFREFSGWGGFYIVPVFGEIVHGYSTGMSGYLLGMLSVGGLVAQPLGGILSDRLGRRWLVAGLLFLTAVLITAVPHAGEAMLVPTVVLFGFCYSATVPVLDAMIGDRAPSSIRGGVFGIIMASGIGLSAFSPLLQARVLDATGASIGGFTMCFGLLGASALVAMVLMMLFRQAGR